MVAAALLVGIGLGWVGSGMVDENANPDLQAMCLTLSVLDTDVLTRLEDGEGDLGDPNLVRLGSLPGLATAAASHPDAPATLAEAGEPLAFELGRADFERVREQVDALREYC